MSAELIQTYSKASSLACLIDDKVDKCVFILNVSLCLLIVHLHCTQLDNKSVTKAEIKTDEDCSTEDKMVTGVDIHHGWPPSELLKLLFQKYSDGYFLIICNPWTVIYCRYYFIIDLVGIF